MYWLPAINVSFQRCMFVVYFVPLLWAEDICYLLHLYKIFFNSNVVFVKTYRNYSPNSLLLGTWIDAPTKLAKSMKESSFSINAYFLINIQNLH